MIDRLINNFLKFGSITESEKDAIAQSSTIQEFNKGVFLLKEGQKSINSYFVLQGCIRQYNLSNGDEITTRFFTEDEWVISADEISENPVSMHNWICMEDCILVSGNEQKARELFERFPKLETISRKIVESAFSEIQKSILFYHSETPEQRYLSLVDKYPGILQRVPQYHIASYIGVKPESLSRIRKRVAREKL
ncbi:MAG: Crp/Fnr family transcriptional regulator [Bacteroidales bacterium]|nr:Crp/Fnr family transcriptional regulator [Bacteroidales bacterium]